jgi:hypothetical protein
VRVYIEDPGSASFDELVASHRHHQKEAEDFKRSYVHPLDDSPEWWGHYNMLSDEARRVEWEMRTRPEWPAHEAEIQRLRSIEDARRKAEKDAYAAQRARQEAERQRKNSAGSVVAGVSVAIALLSLPCMYLQNEQVARFAAFMFWVFLAAAIIFGYKYWRRS